MDSKNQLKTQVLQKILPGLAEDFAIEEINGIPDAIFPDYAFADNPDSQPLQIVALVIGAFITLILGFGVAYVVKK